MTNYRVVTYQPHLLPRPPCHWTSSVWHYSFLEKTSEVWMYPLISRDAIWWQTVSQLYLWAESVVSTFYSRRRQICDLCETSYCTCRCRGILWVIDQGEGQISTRKEKTMYTNDSTLIPNSLWFLREWHCLTKHIFGVCLKQNTFLESGLSK